MITPTTECAQGPGPGGSCASIKAATLLGIEGMSPLEIRALLDRGNYFADHPTDGNSVALHGKTIVNLFYEKLDTHPYIL